MGGIDPPTFIPMNENLSGYPPHFNNVQKFSFIEYILSIKRRHRIVITLSWYQYRILAILLKSIDPNPVESIVTDFVNANTLRKTTFG